MNDPSNQFMQRRLSGFLAAALLFLSLSPALPAAAEGSPSPSETADPVISQEAGFSLVPDTMWYPTSPEQILPGDIIAVTVTGEHGTWALSWGQGESSPSAAVPVLLENGRMLSEGEDLHWQLRSEDLGMVLSAAHSSGFLYAGPEDLRVGTAGTPYWLPDGDSFVHLSTGTYLSLREEDGIWQTASQPSQALSFWRQERTSPVTASPEGGPVEPGSAITLSCETSGAEIYYALSSDGNTYGEFTRYTQPIGAGEWDPALFLKAYASCDGLAPSEERCFSYTRAVPPTEGDKEEDGDVWEMPWTLPYQCYFGQLHAHTEVSDGTGTVSSAYEAAAQAGLDFFAVTEHSDSLDHASSGSINLDGSLISRQWAEGKSAAAAATGKDFVGIYGYEFSWPQGINLGHISTFSTPGWQSWKQEGFQNLEAYYQALTRVPESIGQFCHPGSFYGDFDGFSCRTAAYDPHMALLEIGGEEGGLAYGCYIQALDAGWHVAPSSNQSTHSDLPASLSSRTVILAKNLTENSLYDAIRSRRVYASDDEDLEIYFTLDGAAMGSTLGPSESPTLRAWLQDPSGEELGLVEVVSQGGAVLASQTIEESRAQLDFSLSGSHPYYFLRITQGDGDIAVTAPVWTDTLQDLGIRSFTAGSGLTVAGQETLLSLQLYNEEAMDLTVTSVELFWKETSVCTLSAPGTVAAGKSLTLSVPYTRQAAGPAKLLVRVQGTIGGAVRIREETLELTFHPARTDADILIDGSHENAGLDSLGRFSLLAAKAGLEASVSLGYVPKEGMLLVVTPPKTAFSEDFLQSVTDFLSAGGTLLLCGQGGDPQAMNALLNRAGSSMTLGDRAGDWNSPAVYPEDSPYTTALRPHQFFIHRDGYTVNAGSGSWLAKDESGSVLLAWETLPSGGTLFLSGGSLCSDDVLPPPKNQWDPVSANETILETILSLSRPQLPVTAIENVRHGTLGENYRIQGFTTTGTQGTSGTFPDLLCLQDRTGGIPIVGLTQPGITMDTPLDITGCLQEIDGNLVLVCLWQTPWDIPKYRHVPKTIFCSAAMDYDRRGGSLLQVEGTIRSLKRNGKAITRLEVQDIQGGTAQLILEADNTLAETFREGDAVRARGILFQKDGAPVLRMRRSRDLEPLYREPLMANPMVGDRIFLAVGVLIFSGCALLGLCGRKRAKRLWRTAAAAFQQRRRDL